MRHRAAKAGALVLALTILSAGVAQAERAVVGDVEVAVSSRIEPYRLPRSGTAPISVFIAGHLNTTNHTTPPQLQRLTIKLNRHGKLDPTGLPVCRMDQIQPASTELAVANCGRSLIGSGQFWAQVVFPDQLPYGTQGRLLAFNGREGGKPVVFVHIFTSNPFFDSFVITFSIRHIAHGIYGTELSASLPQALGSWGYLNRIKMTLTHKFRYRGREHSYFNAGCPAAPGFNTALFKLAQATFFFSEGKPLTTTLVRPCAVSK